MFACNYFSRVMRGHGQIVNTSSVRDWMHVQQWFCMQLQSLIIEREPLIPNSSNELIMRCTVGKLAYYWLHDSTNLSSPIRIEVPVYFSWSSVSVKSPWGLPSMVGQRELWFSVNAPGHMQVVDFLEEYESGSRRTANSRQMTHIIHGGRTSKKFLWWLCPRPGLPHQWTNLRCQ